MNFFYKTGVLVCLVVLLVAGCSLFGEKEEKEKNIKISYDSDGHKNEDFKKNNRFELIEGDSKDPFKVLKDKETQCKYIYKANDESTVFQPLYKKDGQIDCD
ncbi:hypothetical protein P4K71_09465 [Bacillus cereus]|uniref:hypothetical protein n=1 Tax=Bacillus cereus group TaxID=86661 RepID=UPI000A35D5E1|nr:hypothetical protein [Bacillus thuringiensis]MEB8736453.1 hypothetical protein [Bacillus cereus]MEB8905281.1 hypothetical protein [Bacillus cereus]MEB9923044.1 hypothetical protein [Bacillus cereus]MEB9986216.1 hypothetical protein [Bacillus cereus]MEB9991434.1 hypothetical protein [Bacillus cereus]